MGFFKLLVYKALRMIKTALSAYVIYPVAGDNLAAINAALAAHDRVYLSGGAWPVSAKVDVPTGKWLELAPTAILQPTTDSDVVQIHQNSKITGGKIDASGLTTFTHSAILVDGADMMWDSKTFIGDIKLVGKSISTGYGIRFTSTSGSGYLSLINSSNVIIKTFYKGLCLEAPIAGSWVNGNNFNNYAVDNCGWAVYLDGDTPGNGGLAGNLLSNFQIQPQPGSIGGIYCSGSINTISCMIWDLGVNGTTNNAVTLTSLSSKNKINILNSIWNASHFSDAGYMNVIDGQNSFTFDTAPYAANLTLPSPWFGMVYDTVQGNHVYAPTAYIGSQDDVLACATYRYAVTNSGFASTGDTVGGAGSYISMFLPGPNTVTSWHNVASPIIINIDLTNETWQYGSLIGILFDEGDIATSIKIEITLSDNSVQTVLNTTTNTSGIVTVPLQYPVNADSGTKAIKFTMSGQAAGHTHIAINRIFGVTSYNFPRCWMPTYGGIFYGPVTFGGGAIGTIAADSATAGNIGECVTSAVASGSAVSLTTATGKSVTSISLTKGDWDVEGNVNFLASGCTTAVGSWVGGISTSNNTQPSDGTEVPEVTTVITTSAFNTGIGIPRKRISISATTTVYLVGTATFTAGTVKGYGSITARRVR